MIEWKKSKDLVDYPTALNLMEKRVEDITSGQAEELIWFLEHPPLLTAGTSAKPEDLLDHESLPVFQAGRGGQYTYHGPGQRVVYLMLDLNKRDPDIKKYICHLEEAIIQTLQNFDIEGKRKEGRIGIWIENKDGSEDKIAAIGVRVRKWVTYHGIAININPNLDHFNTIVPCGIKEEKYGVTSMWSLGKKVVFSTIDSILEEKIKNQFC